MKAFAVSEQGASPAHHDLGIPEPGPGEVRVKVSAASVNGFDLAVAAGWMGAFFEHRYPVVLGREFAGVIDALGAGVTDFEVGDRVLGVVSKPYLSEGAFAEYTTANATDVVLAPDILTTAQAASVAHTGSAALHIVEAIGDPNGKTVLVVGATGGVGTLLVQLLAAEGATVIATGRTEEGRAQLAELGATYTIGYSDLDAAVRAIAPDGVDAVVHLSGDAGDAVALLVDDGVFASPIVYDPSMLPGSERIQFAPIAGYPSPEGLRRLADLADSGDLVVIVDREHSFDDAGVAFGEYGRETIGNIVVVIGDD